MIRREKQSGITLTEMVVVIATIAILATIGLPAARSLMKSFESGSSAQSIINAALSTARAIAVKEQRYAGIRFQQDLDENQYMIFIVHEEPSRMGDLTIGFRAVKGIKPIKLLDKVGVVDMVYDPDLLDVPPGDGIVDSDIEMNNVNVLRDTMTFSIIFSPSGKLVIHDIRVRNRDGKTEGTETPNISRDDIFNTRTKITDPVDPVGMFIQDDYPEIGLGEESSRNSFVICEKDKFRQAYDNGRAWTDYLSQVAPNRMYINPYIGTIINSNL